MNAFILVNLIFPLIIGLSMKVMMNNVEEG
jgi:hypothetical protein